MMGIICADGKEKVQLHAFQILRITMRSDSKASFAGRTFF